MDFVYNLFLVPYYARQIVASGKPWNLAYSVAVVVASFITFDLWAKDSGCRLYGLASPCSSVDMGASVFTLILFLGTWAFATIVTSIKRAEAFNQPVGIDIEAQCLALPFVLVWPAIPIVRFLSMTVKTPFWSLIYNRPMNFVQYNLALALLINIIILTILAVLLFTALTLIREPGDQKSAKDSMSRQIAKMYQTRLTRHKHSSFASVATAASLIFLGGLCWGYQDLFAGGLTLSPVSRGLHSAGFALIFWLITSWIVGKCRVHHAGDQFGMNTAVSSIGWSMARFSILLLIASILRSLGKSAALDAGILKLVFLAAIPMSIDAFLSASSVLILPQSKSSTKECAEISSEENKVDGADQPRQTLYDQSLQYMARASFPPFRTIISNLWSMLSLKGLGILKVKQDSEEAIELQMMGVAIATVCAIIQGFALFKLGIPALGSFSGTGLSDIDYLAGFFAVPIYVVTIAGALYAALKMMKQKFPFAGLLAAVGHSLLGPVIIMALCFAIPSRNGWQLAKDLYPVGLLWAAAFCLLEVGLSITKKSKFVPVLSTTAITVVLTYVIVTQLLMVAHWSVLAAARVPIVDMKQTISYEVPSAWRGDLDVAISNLTNVDLVDVKAGDVISHVRSVRRIGRRFYEEVPSDMFFLRVRHEVTSDAGWMQRLMPIMADVTRDAKNPDEAARKVAKWVRTVVPKPENVDFPFGEKFEQDPITTLNCRNGSTIDVAILMVAALRASGVAARIADVMPDEYAVGSYTLAEYYDGNEWHPCYPSLEVKDKPAALMADVEAIQSWAEQIPEGFRLTFYVQVNGIWYPYCSAGRGTGNGEPGTYSFDLPPGTYLASYVDGDMCYTKKFVLRPAT